MDALGSSYIAGMGWVTPLGAGLEPVWERWMRGDRVEPKPVTLPGATRSHAFLPVPADCVDFLGRTPRLRRSSPISFYAVAAGLAALENAGLPLTPERAARTAVVFATSDGGVQYTRRFYDQIVRQGANAASPLLFPETVYNAPASHLAAQLGLDGASYTLVGDASVGVAALHFAGQLLDTLDIDHCLVVGAEECDWIICEAYRDWRLARTPYAEGAAAVVLSRSGPWRIRTHPGIPFFRRAEMPAALERVCGDLAASGPAQWAVCSASQPFMETAERAALRRFYPDVAELHPKRVLGEAPGASALIQVVAAAMGVQKGMATRVVTPVIGFNQQTAGVVVELS
jgi:3-oxoacyl-[acyl-carrier-protein] synthase II